MEKMIYLLENDEGITEVLQLLFNSEGYGVSAFSSVSSFMAGLSEHVADLFLLDVMLPDGNGIEVCSYLKSLEKTRNVPIIMMSAHADRYDIRRGCAAENFIKKPFDIHDLLRLVAKHI
ncbi:MULTISPECIES: response regulator [Pedobacter]|uniref:Response regulator n=1 Tax=Pedobacter rhodius TaxID=3004098 RepID=A0ABT4L0R1_9SPHI|nr:response regulator [Pedobacter sp. SJ11]MCZ4224767.1 response regulator [Pedobacter sp. SJ11]